MSVFGKVVSTIVPLAIVGVETTMFALDIVTPGEASVVILTSIAVMVASIAFNVSKIVDSDSDNGDFPRL